MDPILCTNAKAVNSRTAEALGNLHTPGYGPFVSPVNRMRNSAPRSTGKDPHVQPRGRTRRGPRRTLLKQVGEDIGRMIARNSDTTVVSLRFTNVALPEVQAEFPWPAPTPENPLTLVMWAYADARDVAEAHVLAVDAEIEEYEAFMLAQPSSRFAEPTVDLVKRNFGDRVEIRDGLEGTASVISTAKAQRMLGWKPRHDWRN